MSVLKDTVVYGDLEVNKVRSNGEGWVDVSDWMGFLNGWVNYNVAWENVKLRMSNGVVEIKGMISGGTSSMFQVPIEYIPQYRCIFMCTCSGGFVRVDMKEDGYLVPVTYGTDATNSWIGLDFKYAI